ncbi:hypothetical protein ED28_03060 [[Pantoea] beijingensis]|uniref:DUF4402 domain-containing protein n=1 Tax=[Pantoea] beijingensis TaxID=1324864 RepID=A0A443IH18_9GAMM|nr:MULTISPECIES: hypothetical protein [Erwiniaceae]RWR03290.1 hypothetical protein ED28_03060 [[Pantoea] beijingensis]
MDKFMVKNILALTLCLLTTSGYAAVPVKTDINVEAEVSTSVRIYVEGKDVTDGSFGVKLEDKNGYMSAITPPFYFIGNASTVSIKLSGPKALTSTEGNLMNVSTLYVDKSSNSGVSTAFPYNNIAVFSSLATVPSSYNGPMISFKSTDKTEVIPLGKYSGTYTLTVTPST